VPKKKSATLDFEASLGELEKIVERMERGEQSLEESLKDFERGIELTRTCQKGLQEAEQRIDKLSEKDGDYSPEPFTPEE
jgi:exodeoxyribonuclease VII small subunit